MNPVRRAARVAALLVPAALTAAVLAPVAASAAAGDPAPAPVGAVVTQTFGYTGGVQSWVVPAGVTSVTVDLFGAEGGAFSISPAGKGGRATATLAVTPGTSLELRVGGSGTSGGYNGGGLATLIGGGATDLRIGGSTLADRVLVAGGGGGGGNCWSGPAIVTGGPGGGLVGGAAASVDNCALPANDGQGGTQSAGGAAGAGGEPGSLGQGGAGASGYGVGGGGGGYYGGGGGGATAGNTFSYRAGGGGSGYGPSGTVFETGVRTGDGAATLTYTPRHDLVVTTSGTGAGRVVSDPAGIDCRGGSGSGCTATFDHRTQVTLTATADGGSTFQGWSGGGCAGTAPCMVTLDQATSVTATFSAATRAPDTTAPDTTAPDTSFSKAPKKRTHKKLTIFRFRSTDQVPSFQCRVDGGGWKPCASPLRKTFRPGRHTFAVRAVDPVGNLDPTPATVSWRFVPLRGR